MRKLIAVGVAVFALVVGTAAARVGVVDPTGEGIRAGGVVDGGPTQDDGTRGGQWAPSTEDDGARGGQAHSVIGLDR